MRHLSLKQQVDPETNYILDMVKMGSPSKDLDNKGHSKNVLKSVNENPVYHNRVRGQI
jgi:hypothetical protein